MAVLELNDIVQLRLYCNAAPQGSINVRHYQVTEVNNGSSSDAAAATAFATLFAPLMKNVISDQTEYGGLQVQIVHPVRRVEVTNITGAGNGVLTGDLLPPAVSGLITLRGDRSGRRFRSRMYAPFPSEAESGVAAAPSAGYLLKLRDLANALLQVQIIGAGLDKCTLTPVVTPRTYLTTERLTSAVVRVNWATQRRRSFINRNDNPGPP